MRSHGYFLEPCKTYGLIVHRRHTLIFLIIVSSGLTLFEFKMNSNWPVSPEFQKYFWWLNKTIISFGLPQFQLMSPLTH